MGCWGRPPCLTTLLELPDPQERVERVAELVQSLPPANYATLRYLLAHLCR